MLAISKAFQETNRGCVPIQNVLMCAWVARLFLWVFPPLYNEIKSAAFRLESIIKVCHMLQARLDITNTGEMRGAMGD